MIFCFSSFLVASNVHGKELRICYDFLVFCNYRKPIVRIGIVGNDSSVASVVTAYVGCRLTKPEYFSSLGILSTSFFFSFSSLSLSLVLKIVKMMKVLYVDVFLLRYPILSHSHSHLSTCQFYRQM